MEGAGLKCAGGSLGGPARAPQPLLYTGRWHATPRRLLLWLCAAVRALRAPRSSRRTAWGLIVGTGVSVTRPIALCAQTAQHFLTCTSKVLWLPVTGIMVLKSLFGCLAPRDSEDDEMVGRPADSIAIPMETLTDTDVSSLNSSSLATQHFPCPPGALHARVGSVEDLTPEEQLLKFEAAIARLRQDIEAYVAPSHAAPHLADLARLQATISRARTGPGLQQQPEAKPPPPDESDRATCKSPPVSYLPVAPPIVHPVDEDIHATVPVLPGVLQWAPQHEPQQMPQFLTVTRRNPFKPDTDVSCTPTHSRNPSAGFTTAHSLTTGTQTVFTHSRGHSGASGVRTPTAMRTPRSGSPGLQSDWEAI